MQWLMMVCYHPSLLNFIRAQKLLGFQQLLVVHISSVSYIKYNLSSFLGVLCAVIAGICPIDIIGEITTVSALITYIFVHIGITVVS
jgi:hypothetical protein